MGIEPNTWRELPCLLDERNDSIVLKGRTVPVQEYVLDRMRLAFEMICG